MKTPLTRRHAVNTLFSGIGLFALSACSSGRRSASGGVGSVGDPLPGGSVASLGGRSDEPLALDRAGVHDDAASSRARELLDAWKGRQSTAPSGVIMRTRWASAGPVVALADPMGAVSTITVHHDGMSPFTSTRQSDAMSRLESIRNAHRGNGWADIGYHYAIDPAGRVYECRPIRFQGAHVKDHNPHNLGILVMGNFMEQRPTSSALAALDAFVADRMKAYRVPISRVYTHQELRPTACPGVSLQRYMIQTRSGKGGMARA